MGVREVGKFFSGAVELRRHAQVSLLRMAIDGFIPLLSSPFVVWLVLSPKAWPRFSAGLFFGAPGTGALLWVQVPSRVDHSERSEAQLREGDRAWGGSVER
nr:hypothetical protein [Pseudomonadales bacterium]